MSDLLKSLEKLSIESEGWKKTTGVVYDDRMVEHSCQWDSKHIEQPKRFICPLQRCKDYNLISRCHLIQSRFAEEREILLLHGKGYIDFVKGTKECEDFVHLEKLSSSFDSIYFHPKTYESALLAAGCTLELVSSVLNGEVRNGMALVRPPGHHAMENEACGFCFFNNVAIAAKYALESHKLEKILIIDWDVHHGQATQQMFYDDPRVLYISIHRYEHGAFWPELRESNFDFVGSGKGRGYNINIPLNEINLGNSDYFAIFNNIILPVAYEFNPELILVSAGYDAALGCPEGEMCVTPQAYAHFTHLLSGLANGKMCVILEGGYCIPSLSESVALTLRSLLGDPCPALRPTSDIKRSLVESILNVITVHCKFWKSLCLQEIYDISENEDEVKALKKHVPEIKYVGTLPLKKRESYPTRDCCPVVDPNVSIVLETELEKLIGEANLAVASHRTCIVFDDRMSKHYNAKEKWHPEKAERITTICEKLQACGLLRRCNLLSPRKAKEEELCLVHDMDYVREIKSTETMKKKDISKMQCDYESVYMCQGTYEAATLACGCLLEIVDAVLKNKCQNGFAIIRPPGHHASIGEASGFCIFNSVAVAARYALVKHSAKKILIVDWDVHHGNGTQNIFQSDDRVLYISLHRHDGGTFFPCVLEQGYLFAGEDGGLGFNINIPWNGCVGDGDYLAAFFHIILPVAYEYGPDLVFVSAGFDAVQNDPLGGCEVSPECFGHMTSLLSSLANGRIILALEGGYNVSKTSDAVINCIEVLLGEPCHMLDCTMKPSQSAIESIQNVREVHQKYWNCLQFCVGLPNMEKWATSSQALIDTDQFIFASSNAKPSSPVFIPNKEIEARIEVVENVEGIAAASIACVNTLGFTHENEDDYGLFCVVTPLDDCPHLELLQSLPAEGLDPKSLCQECSDPRENWVCLHCYQVYCARLINGHMLTHGVNMQHYLTLSYSDLSVWCYGCDSYVHNEMLLPAKEHVHMKKFGIPM